MYLNLLASAYVFIIFCYENLYMFRNGNILFIVLINYKKLINLFLDLFLYYHFSADK